MSRSLDPLDPLDPFADLTRFDPFGAPPDSSIATRLAQPLAGHSVFVACDISCTASRSQVGRYRQFLIDHGAAAAETLSEADIVLVDTCAFSHEQEHRSLALVDQKQSQTKPTAKLIVTGCLAGINPEALRARFAGEFFSPRSQEQLGDIFGLSEAAKAYFAPTKIRAAYNRIRIDGLSRRRGWRAALDSIYALHRSVPLGAIVEEIRRAVGDGARDIILTSEDTAAYGIDIGTNFVTLLERIHAIEAPFNLYVFFFDPRWLAKYEAGLGAVLEQGRIRHLQLPLQSGSDKVLRAMKRGYTTAQVLPVVARLRNRFPALCLTSQFITGFPGESEADFAATEAVLKQELFDFSEIFPYEERPRTAALAFADPVEVSVRRSRAEALSRIAARQRWKLLLRRKSIPADLFAALQAPELSVQATA